ncbi:MAG: ClpXP protease specificity-enhancing factor SspB [Rhodobacteraceae bacterium]|nr:ClpXP protease specificity-enhancing factor SspB [Paracoccaceae bacterium]
MDRLDYQQLTRKAMNGLVQDVLGFVAERGLPEPHWFVIKFSTRHPQIQMDDVLLRRYPTSMRIVLQEWFDDLAVDEHGFGVVLNFDDVPQHIYVPFAAIHSFHDPGVGFGLQLVDESGMDEPVRAAELEAEPPALPEAEAKPDSGTAPNDRNGKVIELDKFRPR